MPGVSEYFPCEDGILPRKLSIRKVLERRPVTICLQQSSVLPLSMLVLQVLFHYENLRWLYHGALKKICCNVSENLVGGGKEEVLPVKGNSRKAETAWDFWRYFVLSMDIFFNVAAEKETHGIRNMLFLIDDFVSLYDIYYLYHAGRFTLQKKRLLVCFVAVFFSWVMILGVVNSNDNMNIS